VCDGRRVQSWLLTERHGWVVDGTLSNANDKDGGVGGLNGFAGGTEGTKTILLLYSYSGTSIRRILEGMPWPLPYFIYFL